MPVAGAVIGLATSVYSASQAKKQQKKAQQFAEQQMEQMDPFGKYRDQYAQRLNAFMSDPSYLENTAAYKMRLQAANRSMAAQGYTGSGNGTMAAAEAASMAYQQEFDNLAMLSGATNGQSARASAYGTAAGAMSQANDNYLGGLAGVANNLTNTATIFGNSYGKTGSATTSIGSFNAPVATGSMPTVGPY